MNTVRALALAGLASVALAIGMPSDPPRKVTLRPPTFATDVAPILYEKCASCHHPGEVAPFSLMSYADAKNMAKTIAHVTKQRIMPPWQATSNGEFANERKLTAKEIDTLNAWVAAGSPAGDLKKAPKPPSFTPGWLIGKPDFVGAVAKPYPIGAEGADEYRCFVIPTNFSEDRYVNAVELRPGNRKIVHHIIVFIDTSGAARKMDGKDGKPGYESFGGPGIQPSGSLGGWAPGLEPQVLAPNTGFLLPKGADIILQMHYHKNGKAESDLTKIGLQFLKGKADKEVRFEAIGEEIFKIPAGHANYEVAASMTLDHPITMLDVLPHMHLLGRDMIVTATLPNGTKKQLVKVDNYDFNWQTSYKYKEPLKLPAGTKLSLVAHYDNSANNPHNPNQPPKMVRFGEQTTDEMCFAFFSYTFDAEHLAKGIRVKRNDETQAQRVIEHIFDKFDEDRDGYLTEADVIAIIEYFEGPGEGSKKSEAQSQAKLGIAFFGKKKKGMLTKPEFVQMVSQISK